MDYSLPSSSVRGILQARILEWVAKGFPGGSNGKESAVTMRDIQLQSLGSEDPLEKGMATHSSILAWRIGINTWKRGWKREWAERVKPRCGPSDSVGKFV